MSVAVGEAKLAMIGMSQKNIKAVIADVVDGKIDNPAPDQSEAAV
jgi:hypothetical protein